MRRVWNFARRNPQLTTVFLIWIVFLRVVCQDVKEKEKLWVVIVGCCLGLPLGLLYIKIAKLYLTWSSKKIQSFLRSRSASKM